MPGAARATLDNHLCPMVDGVKPHVGGPCMGPASLNVKTETQPQMRATDKATCAGPPDFIVTGSGSVLVNGLPAARQTDKTMHGGSIALGSLTVIIGGPTVGATLGGVGNGTAACNAAAGGRTTPPGSRSNGSPQGQSYNNCGVESSRQLINQATGRNVGEDALLDDAMNHGEADRERSRGASGGATSNQIQNTLGRYGVPTSQQPQTMPNITQAVAEGRGVITGHDVAVLWGPGQTGGHGVVVTGLQYDANGNLVNVITNDTGLGICGRAVPAGQFQSSLLPGFKAVVTNNPIW